MGFVPSAPFSALVVSLRCWSSLQRSCVCTPCNILPSLLRRKVAWAVAAEAPALPLLTVERIAGRAAVGELWRILADFAVSAVVPKRAQCLKLTQQPFVAWHVVLSGGNGLRVVRH